MRQIDLAQITRDHHPRILPKPCQHHFHLYRGGVLRLVNDDIRLAQGAATHECQRRNLDLAAGQHPVNLVGWHHVIECVIERAQIRVDLFLHIAG